MREHESAGTVYVSYDIIMRCARGMIIHSSYYNYTGICPCLCLQLGVRLPDSAQGGRR